MGIDRYLKAIIASVLAGLGSAQVALLQGGITYYEWVGVAIVTLAALTATYAVRNTLAADDVAFYLAKEQMKSSPPFSPSTLGTDADPAQTTSESAPTTSDPPKVLISKLDEMQALLSRLQEQVKLDAAVEEMKE